MRDAGAQAKVYVTSSLRRSASPHSLHIQIMYHSHLALLDDRQLVVVWSHAEDQTVFDIEPHLLALTVILDQLQNTKVIPLCLSPGTNGSQSHV